MNLRIIKAGVLVFLSVFMGILSCSDDDTEVIPVVQNITQTQIETNLQSETWRITLFIDSGVDDTKNFAGYKFIFNSSKVLDTGNGTKEYQGTWSITDSNSADDTQDDLEFNIHFDLTNDFEDLNDDWDFVSNSATKIELTDISGGNGDIDYLTFEKNRN
jgi:hypothetical protein